MKNNVKENEEKQKQKPKAKEKQQHQYLESSDSFCTEPKFWGPWISQIQIKQGLYNNKHIFVIRACRALHCDLEITAAFNIINAIIYMY